MKTFLFKSSLFTMIFLILMTFLGHTPAAVEAAPKPSNTPKPTKTTRPTNTPRFTFTPTLTFTPTDPPTDTPTNTPTLTFTPTDIPTETPTATASPTDTPVPANLLAYWKFDEGTGSTVADSSGNGHTFFMNDQEPVFGNIGRLWTSPAAPTTFSNPLALKLLPAYPPQTLISTGTIDLANKSFSVAMWVARTRTDGRESSDGQEMFFSHGNDGPLTIGFRASGAFTCAFNQDYIDTSAITLDGNWHHYVCTYDAVNGVRKAYKDGVLVGSDIPLGNYVGAGPVQIGRWNSGGSVGIYVGIVDDTRIYDAALSEAQVAALAERDPAYTPAPCTPHALLQPAEGLKIPQLLQLWATVDNGCETPPGTDPFTFTPERFTFTWSCASDTSVECPTFLASANTPPNGNWSPMLNLQESDIISVWVTLCLVDNPSVCSTDHNIYYAAPVDL